MRTCIRASIDPNAKKSVVVIGLNPSIANAEKSDRTFTKVGRYLAQSWQQCTRLFEMGIRSIEDIRKFPMEEIEKIKFSMPEIYGRLKDAKRKLECEE